MVKENLQQGVGLRSYRKFIFFHIHFFYILHILKESYFTYIVKGAIIFMGKIMLNLAFTSEAVWVIVKACPPPWQPAEGSIQLPKK